MRARQQHGKRKSKDREEGESLGVVRDLRRSQDARRDGHEPRFEHRPRQDVGRGPGFLSRNPRGGGGEILDPAALAAVDREEREETLAKRNGNGFPPALKTAGGLPEGLEHYFLALRRGEKELGGGPSNHL